VRDNCLSRSANEGLRASFLVFGRFDSLAPESMLFTARGWMPLHRSTLYWVLYELHLDVVHAGYPTLKSRFASQASQVRKLSPSRSLSGVFPDNQSPSPGYPRVQDRRSHLGSLGGVSVRYPTQQYEKKAHPPNICLSDRRVQRATCTNGRRDEDATKRSRLFNQRAMHGHQTSSFQANSFPPGTSCGRYRTTP